MSSSPLSASDAPDDRGYSVNELADAADVTPRTVHYYISRGLLPASGKEGRGTRYGQGHLDRLRLIRELQREHLPLAEIRQRLEQLPDDQIADLLAAGEIEIRRGASAFQYIQSVLAGTSHRAFPLPVPARTGGVQSPAAAVPPAAAPEAPSRPTAAGSTGRATDAPQVALAPAAGAPQVALAPAAHSPSEPMPSTRSQWERISLGPDVELHVRRPLSRHQNRAVDRLVGLARKLLEEDPS